MADKPDKDDDPASPDSPSGAAHAESTATSAATADPVKIAQIRAQREIIENAQAAIRGLTGGRESRTGGSSVPSSSLFSVGSMHAVREKTVTETIKQTIRPTTYKDPKTGEVKQIPPPVPGGSGGSGSTESAPETHAIPSTSKALDPPAALTPIGLVPGPDEAIAVRITAETSDGQRVRFHTNPEASFRMADVVSISNAFGEGTKFKGRVVDMSQPLIVQKDRVMNFQRTDASKLKIAREEAERNRKAAEAMKAMQPADDDMQLVMDLDPPAPAEKPAEATLKDSSEEGTQATGAGEKEAKSPHDSGEGLQPGVDPAPRDPRPDDEPPPELPPSADREDEAKVPADGDEHEQEVSARAKRALARGKKTEGIPPKGAKPTNVGSLEVAAWLRNVDEQNPDGIEDPPQLQTVMKLTAEVSRLP